MPIFGRRQLQQMLEELGPWLDRGKAKDLLNRLENVRPNQSLPAEYELSISWAVSKIATLEIDRPAGSRTPDIYSPDLLMSGPMVADVAAIDDFTLSGSDKMRRACNIINAEADRLLSESSKHLHFTFREESGYERSNRVCSSFFRRRLIRRDFQLDSGLKCALKNWLANGKPSQPLSWNSPAISVLIEWREFVHPLSNYFCTMPSLAYHVSKNPLYTALRLKSKQLLGAPDGARRLIFLGDAGCGLLRDLGLSLRGPSPEAFSGGQIILRFLKDYPEIDFVLVVSAKPEWGQSASQATQTWSSQLFTQTRDIADGDLERLNLLMSAMLPPNLSGYQAYSWHEQGMCEANAIGKYVPTKMCIRRERMTVRISARAMQELIAGRLSPETFRTRIFGGDNPVCWQLDAGRTISSARFEPQGNGEDDDYLVLEFSDDPAARGLQMPSQLKEVAHKTPQAQSSKEE
jgi:hypothetical protein